MDEKKSKIPFIFHILFFVIVIGVIVIGCLKFSNLINGGILFSQEEIDAKGVDTPDTEALDYILPLLVDEENIPVDDGITTIVCFGNSPFSDDRNESTNLCNQIAALADATVYNCSIPGSYMSALNYSFFPDSYPMDAFSFYWLTTGFSINNAAIFDKAIEAMGDDFPDIADIKEAVALLNSIDFNTVDAIAIMYDGSDYLAGREMYNDNDFTDPQQFTGSMAAGVKLIQEIYPHIRIFVLSPTYAFGVEENGTYVSSDIKTYGWSFLSTYLVKQAEAAYELEVSFIDNLYGTIHEDIAKDYLTDNIHLNVEGRKLVAKRFVDCFNMYNHLGKSE